MTPLAEKIQSMREGLGISFTKPDPSRLDTFINDLDGATHAQDYLRISRGLSDETIKHFKLGYDKEKDAIAIPVFKRGELINIRYRYLDENKKPKYTQEKGCEVWIYNEDGISVAQEKKGVLIVEGEFDCMSVWQAGIKNVISPASGKDSYGVWIELIDTIPRVYISYDNDKPGKTAALQMAERVGTDKSFEVLYPPGIKDANEYFMQNTLEGYKKLIKDARPFYKYKFAGVGDVIASLRDTKDVYLKLSLMPYVQMEDDWLVVVSGRSNVGKTGYSLNLANELIEKDIPVLVLPFERGTKSVGKRFIQVRYQKDQNQLEAFDDDDWNKLMTDAVDLPLYFSVPKREEVADIIARAKRMFGVKVVIVDHLDYLVRKSDNNHNVETSNTLQEFKSLAQEYEMIFLVVHHIKKQNVTGAATSKPGMEDLKGSSSTYQDPEAVIMLSSPGEGLLEVDVVKNKGPMGSKVYDFNLATGSITEKKEAYIPPAPKKKVDPYSLDDI